MQLLTSGLGALIVIGICGLVGFVIVADARRGHAATAADAPAATGNDLGSQAADPKPLSLDEVFPDPAIRTVPGAAPYQVEMTHVDTDCQIAATGGLGDLLVAHGCTQLVRAAVTAPYGGYRVTAGIFNLVDAASAGQVDEQVRQLVDGGAGSFAAMESGVPGADPLLQPMVQVGWHSRGHYLVYCVIARPDGAVVTDDDPYARRITVDLVESYLVEQVLGRRAGGTA
jgi:hypothetical protein